MFSSVSWLLGVRYTLARQRSRSVALISRIAMAGIILGVALLIVVLSVMNGFDRELRERILNIMPQITLYHREGIQEWKPIREQLLDDERVIAAAPFIELQGMANSGRETEPVLIYGVDAELEPTISIINQYLEAGSLELLQSDRTAIILGHVLAKKLKLNKGDTFNLIIPRAERQSAIPAVRRVNIVDILQTGTEVDGALALMGLNAAGGLSVNPERISGLHIKGEDLFLSSYLARELQSRLPYGFYTSDWTRSHGNIYHAIQISKNLVSLLLMLIIAIAAFNVVSTLVMVVVDKQGDIAILRTLGLSARQTLQVFMVQGALIGVIGTFIGVLIGIALALSIQNIVVFIESIFSVQFLKSDIYPISYLPSSILWSDVAWVVLVSLVMSLIATVYPAWRAAKVKPADALRYE